MDEFYFIATYGIPFIGIVICIFAGKFLHTLTKKRTISRSTALLSYLICTFIPILLAYFAMRYGSYLGNEHKNYVLYGEATWALLTYTIVYSLFAIVCIIVFWIEILNIPDHV